ncbi:helix-turn-helix domain-containing protein (plasmid) [Exiguobacterium sp. Helios]|uniref:helix-turn-helix domain-containing protein n=1 Tax=Exiguobacterium sp. Helios TaxID=2735868 RepID=UPI00165D4183|nr:helix-turn-helix domain-containing protein [Exiguobacterium sp. Helios]QNR22508.1 helix-turn-helix domain-containing protein [Exiguobacterium sp. Helios]
MLNKERLGLEIKKIRKSKKITQKELSADICSQSEISRIETGDFFPGIDLLYSIATKLTTPLTHFFDILTYEEVELTKEIKSKILGLSYKKEYSELLIYIEELLNSPFPINGDLEKFILWKKYVAAYYLGRINAETCRVELMLLILNKSIGSDVMLNFHIQNSAANIMAENKKYNDSFVLYQKILDEVPIDIDGISLKIKVLYNLGKLSYIEKNYSNSLKYTNEGIELSIESSNMSLLGQYYYQKGAVFEALNYDAEQIGSAYSKSLFFFELLKLDVHKKILIQNKGTYISNS